MKHFLKRFLVQCIAILLLHIIIVYCSLLISRQFCKYSFLLNKKEVNEGDLKFIMGNSHPECAINDGLLPKDHINIALSAEPLFYTVIKARKLIEENPKIDTIYIEFTNNSLNTVNWVLGNDRLYTNYCKYFSIMTFNEHFFIFKNNPNKMIKAFFSLTPKKIWLSNKIIDGKFLSLKRNFKIHKVENEKIQKRLNDRIYNRDDQLIGFKKLLDLIETHSKITFILTRMPQYPGYLGFQNEPSYKRCLSRLLGESNCRFFDFTKVHLESKHFGDYEHLNSVGASKFTRIFRRKIIKN